MLQLGVIDGCFLTKPLESGSGRVWESNNHLARGHGARRSREPRLECERYIFWEPVESCQRQSWSRKKLGLEKKRDCDKPMKTAMKCRISSGAFLCVVIVLCSVRILAQEQASPSRRDLAFTHVTVIDVTGGPVQPDMTVVVSGNRITAVGKTGQVNIPRNALVTNASKQFMIPGLWEMHTHAFIRSRKSFPLYVMYLLIANGITGVRDMGSPGERDDFGDFPYLQDLEWRQAIDAGAIIGPRLNLALTVVNGPHVPGYPRAWAAVSNAEEARAEVIYLKKLGADFIKVYDQLSRDSYFAIADEAKKQGMPFAGHVPILISAAEASDAGQKSLEHNYSVLLGCSTKEKELMQKEEELYGAGKPAMRGILSLDDVKALIASYSEEKVNSLFAKFVKNGTYVTPTIVRASVDRVPATDPQVKYFSPALRAYSYPPSAKAPRPDVLEAQRLMYEYQLRLVKAMERSGVKMLAGTDNSFFGSAVHDELAEMVKAGLTPMEALQTATINPAEYFGKRDAMGTVEKGKLADLVVLDGNPLESIQNVRKVSAVRLSYWALLIPHEMASKLWLSWHINSVGHRVG
jgi:imidazolonepropionase-like amidohydrolase